MSYLKRIKKFFIFLKTYNKGMNREFAGEYDKALREFVLAVSLNYNSIDVYKALIRLNKKNRMYQNALDYIETACKKFPENAFLHAQAADIHRIMKEYNLAIKEYDKAVFYDDTCIDYYRYRAQIKYYTEDIQGAINDYNAALLRENKFSDLYSQRAFYRFEKKSYEGAVEDYTKAIELNPEKPHLYFMRSCAYKQLNQLEQAEKDMSVYEKGFSKL